MTDALDQMIAGYPFDCHFIGALDYRTIYTTMTHFTNSPSRCCIPVIWKP